MDEYGGLDKWLRASNTDSPVTAHATEISATAGAAPRTHSGAVASGYAGGYGGLGYGATQPWDGMPRQAPPDSGRVVPKWTHGACLSQQDSHRPRADRVHILLAACSATPGCLVCCFAAMSAVAGGFEWMAEHGPVGGLPTLDFPE